jgi:hypothetical protein
MQNTTDVWFIAFLMDKGFKIDGYSKISRGKVDCRFAIDDKTWNDLKLEYNNSDLPKWKALVGRAKDLGY